jgi:hypothetical protein
LTDDEEKNISSSSKPSSTPTLPSVERPTTEKLALHLQKTNEPNQRLQLGKRTVSFQDAVDVRHEHIPDTGPRSSHAPSLADESTVVGVGSSKVSEVVETEPQEEIHPLSSEPMRMNRYVAGALSFASNFRVPSTIVMSGFLRVLRLVAVSSDVDMEFLVPSLIIALVKPLKALFVTVDGFYMPSAPDGNPPLAFIMAFATFVGNTTVPLSLVLLGSSLGRMAIPRPVSKLPLAAIFLLAFAKLALMPILGVIIVRFWLLLATWLFGYLTARFI